MGGVVQAADGSLYGTTALGGAHSLGTVFRTALGIVVTMHSFSGSPGEGANPTAKLVRGSDGNFYGTTVRGGAQNLGTAFKISALGSFTMLHSFSGSPGDGASPLAGLVRGSDGNFYGTTALGGEHYLGTAFKINSTGTLTTLHSFSASSGEGADPLAGLVQGSERCTRLAALLARALIRSLAWCKPVMAIFTARPRWVARTIWARSSRSLRQAV